MDISGCAVQRFLRSRAALFASLALAGTVAHAELVDRIEVGETAGAGTEIVLRMTTQVLYLRHAPLGIARDLRVYLRAAGIDGVGPVVERESRTSPPDPRLPRFRLSYPESDGALLLSFDQPARFRVSQGPDVRSIRVTVLPAVEAGSGRGSAQ